MPQLAVPGLALLANYVLNIMYYRLWRILDPPRPADDEALTKEEILVINECDEHLAGWAAKHF